MFAQTLWFAINYNRLACIVWDSLLGPRFPLQANLLPLDPSSHAQASPLSYTCRHAVHRWPLPRKTGHFSPCAASYLKCALESAFTGLSVSPLPGSGDSKGR